MEDNSMRYCLLRVKGGGAVVGWVIGNSADYICSRFPNVSNRHVIMEKIRKIEVEKRGGQHSLGQGFVLLTDINDEASTE
jgi:hypothetical protein